MTTTLRRALPSRTGPGRLLGALDRVERASGADPALMRVRRWVHQLPLGRGRDLLHGRWLGHPVHPLSVQVPIGAWLSSAILDLIPGDQRHGSRALIGVGIAAALPATASGLVDWSETQRAQMRVGGVHALANTVALACYGGSLAARVKGREQLGRGLSLAGLTAVGVGGMLGGHLAYRQASGANHAEEIPNLVASGWHPVGDLADLPQEQPVRRMLGDVPVVLVRQGETVHALADRCSHLGGPLSQGELVDGCLRCPWHGSTFQLSNGWNVRGPATAPQPSFDTRVTRGRVEVRMR